MYQWRGFLYTQIGEYDFAIPDYQKAIDLLPDTYSYCELGRNYIKKKEYDAAKAAILAGIELDENNAECLSLLKDANEGLDAN